MVGHDTPKISEKMMANLSLSADTLFRALTEDRDSPFPAPFRSSFRGPDVYPEFGRPSDVISSQKRGHFGDTWISRDP